MLQYIENDYKINPKRWKRAPQNIFFYGNKDSGEEAAATAAATAAWKRRARKTDSIKNEGGETREKKARKENGKRT